MKYKKSRCKQVIAIKNTGSVDDTKLVGTVDVYGYERVQTIYQYYWRLQITIAIYSRKVGIIL